MTKRIPLANGVPGVFNGQPPTWLAGTPFPVLNTLDDPRWRGATRQGFPLVSGTAESAAFRALYHVRGGITSLYLSFHVRSDPSLDNTLDKIYIGFRSGGSAIVIEVTPYNSAAAVTNQPANAFAVSQRVGADWSPIGQPTWLDTTTRIWLTTAPVSWAVQMVVPLAGASLTDNAGPNLTDPFGLWYFFQVKTPGGITRYEWLPGQPPTTAANIQNAIFPDPANWDSFQRSGGGVVDQGIELRYYDIGTTNADSSEILFRTSTPPPRPVNTFFCRPRNYTANTIALNEIVARFRIVNWGSVAAPIDVWQDVPGGGTVTNSALTIPPLTDGNDPPETNPIAFNWTLSNADIANFNLNPAAGARTHKCMLVELAGPNLTFRNDSMYRNMDFVKASLFRREAEINIVGLTPITPQVRDVYLAIETVNMPAQVQPGAQTPQPTPAIRSATFTRRLDANRDDDNYYPDYPPKDQPPEPTLEDLLASTPTYRVHVYHDTGERVDINGVTYPVLDEQSPFGYFLEHDGPLVGWRHSITAPPEAQLTQIAPDFYRIAVPNGGSVKIVTEIEAKEKDDRPGRGDETLSGCIIKLFQLLIAIFRLGVHALERLIKELRS